MFSFPSKATKNKRIAIRSTVKRRPALLNQKFVSYRIMAVSILKIVINKGINYALVSNCHQVPTQLSHLHIKHLIK